MTIANATAGRANCVQGKCSRYDLGVVWCIFAKITTGHVLMPPDRVFPSANNSSFRRALLVVSTSLFASSF